MRRSRVSMKRSRKHFSATSRPHPANRPRGVMRGGIRF